MSFADKTLTCRECGATFPFTSSEQQFFADKGFVNEPSRCADCRASRKATRGYGDYSSGGGGGGGSRGGGGGYGMDRQMFSATCSSCGKEAQVPFQPRGDKPVYCSDCFRSQRGSGGGGGGDRRSSRSY
ncbi:MAG: zinc-ribbon domain containing protein [Chloroflexota bacterium]